MKSENGIVIGDLEFMDYGDYTYTYDAAQDAYYKQRIGSDTLYDSDEEEFEYIDEKLSELFAAAKIS